MTQWIPVTTEYYNWRCTRKNDGTGESVLWNTVACGKPAVLRAGVDHHSGVAARCEKHAIMEGLMNRTTTHPEPKHVEVIAPTERRFKLKLGVKRSEFTYRDVSGNTEIQVTVTEDTARELFRELSTVFASKLPHICGSCGFEDRR